MTDSERLDVLEAELDRLRSESEIVKIENQYGYYLDSRMWAEAAELWTDDGSIEIGRRGEYRGKANIHRFFQEVLGGDVWGIGEHEFANHIQLQPVVTISDDRQSAQLRCRAMVVAGWPTGAEELLWAEGIYENTFLRVDGRWKIHTMIWAPTFYLPMPGFGERASYLSAPPTDVFPPTGPATIPIDPVLGRQFVGFHYPHPFTGERHGLPYKR